MTLTPAWLKQHHVCADGVAWFTAQSKTTPVEVVKALMAEEKLAWANWLIVRVMTRPQYLAYAIYAAEQVLEIYERQYPEDARPRQAIEAAKACRDTNTAGNKKAADAAASAAAADADAAKSFMQRTILTYGLSVMEHGEKPGGRSFVEYGAE